MANGRFQLPDITDDDDAGWINFDCAAPASVALRVNMCQRVVDVVIGALADALPDQVITAANGANMSAVFVDIDLRTGNQYIYLETRGGVMGASASKEGKDGVQVNITSSANLPVEAIEMEYPLPVKKYALIAFSGGGGIYHGGMGIWRSIRPVGHQYGFNGVGDKI